MVPKIFRQPIETSFELLQALKQCAADLLWPPVCATCPRPLALVDDQNDLAAHFCPQCQSTVRLLPLWACPLCARPWPEETNHTCGDCLTNPPPWQGAKVAASYEGSVAHSIARLKYYGALDQTHVLAAVATSALTSGLTSAQREVDSGFFPDLIIPLPISEHRFATRGFNQSAELARLIYAPWAKLISENFLVRTKGEVPQAALTAKERAQAIKGSFQVTGEVRGRRILLFDDVLTTGATLGEATETLLARGASQVNVAAVARTCLHSWRLW